MKECRNGIERLFSGHFFTSGGPIQQKEIITFLQQTSLQGTTSWNLGNANNVENLLFFTLRLLNRIRNY